MAAVAIHPMLIAAVTVSVDRCVGRVGGAVEPPAGHDLPTLWRYWQRAAALAGEDLALQVAADLPVGAFGVASYQAVSASTLGSALEALDGHLGALVQGMRLRVVPVSRDHAEVRVDGGDEALLVPMLEEIVLAVIFHHLPLLTTSATIAGVALRRPAPADRAAWRAFFGVLPRFAQRATALRFATADLALPLRTANPTVQALVQAAGTGERSAPLAPRVKAHLRTSLRAPLDPEVVARALGLTGRTLQRRLQAEATSLRDLAAAVRIEVARELLEKTELAVAEVGELVGFARPASFTRAFASATGETPQAYRKRHA